MDITSRQVKYILAISMEIMCRLLFLPKMPFCEGYWSCEEARWTKGNEMDKRNGCGRAGGSSHPELSSQQEVLDHSVKALFSCLLKIFLFRWDWRDNWL